MRSLAHLLTIFCLVRCEFAIAVALKAPPLLRCCPVRHKVWMETALTRSAVQAVQGVALWNSILVLLNIKQVEPRIRLAVPSTDDLLVVVEHHRAAVAALIHLSAHLSSFSSHSSHFEPPSDSNFSPHSTHSSVSSLSSSTSSSSSSLTKTTSRRSMRPSWL